MSNINLKQRLSVFLLVVLSSLPTFAADDSIAESWLRGTGVIATVVLVVIVLAIAVIIGLFRLNKYLDGLKRNDAANERLRFNEDILSLKSDEIDHILEQRKEALNYKLTGEELGSGIEAVDKKGLIYEVTDDPAPSFVATKQRRSSVFLKTDPELKKIVFAYLAGSAFWLLFGTIVGELAALKFVWPELDHASWLSFSRLRPVHTNTVFWGFGSLGMIGLAYFVVPWTSNTKIHSSKLAWIAFWLFNINLILGNLLLMAGVNNGGGEYREYIWPVFVPFFIFPLVLTFINYYQTVAKRTVKEIYVSNWFIFAALLWTGVVAITAYLPINGLGETAIQGYYMHMGVGMWFMTFTLGLVYYYLPASINKPIYSYALGVIALWTQLLFYSMIGTHHFIFSPLPWWLQTIAIIFSIGMVIPVTAGTANFLLTMRGKWDHLAKSYIMPFFLVGVIYYFVGSMQGSVQATRYTNYVWHFTDFNVAHSHMTMYGIIAFILWACMYYILPKLSGREPKQFLVGGHFWMAFIGLFVYSIPLMIGGTFRGLSWLENAPFMQSVVMMKPYWVWRAVGGSMMLLSHFIFAYNIYYMLKGYKLKKSEREYAMKQEKEESLTAKTI